MQECLRDARRVESITGQQEDRDNYVVPTRCVFSLGLLRCPVLGCGSRANRKLHRSQL